MDPANPQPIQPVTPQPQAPVQPPMVPQTPVPSPVQPPYPTQTPKSGSKTVLFLAIFLLVIALVALAAYFLSSNLSLPFLSRQKACTQEAKLCPDGSYVGRSGPNCEFTPCPSFIPTPIEMPTASSSASPTSTASATPKVSPTASPSSTLMP